MTNIISGLSTVQKLNIQSIRLHWAMQGGYKPTPQPGIYYYYYIQQDLIEFFECSTLTLFAVIPMSLNPLTINHNIVKNNNNNKVSM